MKKIKRILIKKRQWIGIANGEIEIEKKLNSRASIVMKASKHKNYLDDPRMFVEIFYITI